MRSYKKLKSIRRCLIVVSIIFIFAAGVAAQTKKTVDWAGTYTFFDGPRSSSSSAARRSDDSYALTPGVEYNLTVKRKGNDFSATLEINGMQQFEVCECSAKATATTNWTFIFSATARRTADSAILKISKKAR